MTHKEQLFARFAQDALSKNLRFAAAQADKGEAALYTREILYGLIPQLIDTQRIDDMHSRLVHAMAHAQLGHKMYVDKIGRWKEIIAEEVDSSFDSLDNFEQELAEYMYDHVTERRVKLTNDFLEGVQRAIVATLTPHYLLVTQTDMDNLRLLLSLGQQDLLEEAILHHRMNIMESLMVKKPSLDDT